MKIIKKILAALLLVPFLGSGWSTKAMYLSENTNSTSVKATKDTTDSENIQKFQKKWNILTLELEKAEKNRKKNGSQQFENILQEKIYEISNEIIVKDFDNFISRMYPFYIKKDLEKDNKVKNLYDHCSEWFYEYTDICTTPEIKSIKYNDFKASFFKNGHDLFKNLYALSETLGDKAPKETISTKSLVSIDHKNQDQDSNLYECENEKIPAVKKINKYFKNIDITEKGIDRINLDEFEKNFSYLIQVEDKSYSDLNGTKKNKRIYKTKNFIDTICKRILSVLEECDHRKNVWINEGQRREKLIHMKRILCDVKIKAEKAFKEIPQIIDDSAEPIQTQNQALSHKIPNKLQQNAHNVFLPEESKDDATSYSAGNNHKIISKDLGVNFKTSDTDHLKESAKYFKYIFQCFNNISKNKNTKIVYKDDAYIIENTGKFKENLSHVWDHFRPSEKKASRIQKKDDLMCKDAMHYLTEVIKKAEHDVKFFHPAIKENLKEFLKYIQSYLKDLDKSEEKNFQDRYILDSLIGLNKAMNHMQNN